MRSGRRPAGRRPRRAGPVARYGAPAAFLLAATIAILLIHAALGGKTTPGRPAATTVRSTPVATTTVAAKPKQRPVAGYYVIQRGDSFGAVASRLHLSVQQIEALNPGVSSNSLHVGQRIRVR